MDANKLVYFSALISILCVSPACAEEERLYISTTNNTWNTSCGGSRPFAVTGVNLTTLSIDGDFSFMLEGQKAWIGYYRRPQYFSLEGCSKIPPGTKKEWIKKNSPGHCLSVCKEYNYTGLEGSVCNCISDDEFNQMSRTSDACPYRTCHGGILCGNSTASWIYAARKRDFANPYPEPSADKVQCITLERFISATWKASNCDEVGAPIRTLCLKNGTTLDADALNSRQYSWISAIKVCKNSSENIADIDLGKLRATVITDARFASFSSAWTSFILDSVIVKGGPGKNETDPISCGTVQKTNGAVNLVFENCGTRMPAICVNGVTTMISMLANVTSESRTSSSKHNNAPTTATLVNTTTASTATSQQAIPPATTVGYSSRTADFPMYGRIGLGILLVLVIAGTVLVIRRCKMNGIEKNRPLSSQASLDPSDHIDKLFRGITMSDIDAKEVRNIEDEHEMHNNSKYTSDDWPEPGDPRNNWDIKPDPNYEHVQVNGNTPKSNSSQANSAVLIDNKDPTSYGYTPVNIAAKRSPKIIETRQASDSSMYDLTYVHQREGGNAGGDYNHIYDHAKSKNSPNSAEYDRSGTMGQRHGRNKHNRDNVVPYDSNWMFKYN